MLFFGLVLGMASLVLKIPKDKPPYIGVRYDSTFSGEAHNKDFFAQHLGQELHLVIEVIPRMLKMKLICNNTLQIHTFSQIYYDPVKLKNWLYITRDAKKFNFGCSTLKKDEEKIIRVLNSNPFNLVLKLNKIQIMEQGVETFLEI